MTRLNQNQTQQIGAHTQTTQPKSYHFGVAKVALEIAHNKAVFDPTNDRCELLATDYPELCTAVLLAADGDTTGLQLLNQNTPDLFEYVFHKVRILSTNYDTRMADIARAYEERANGPQTQAKAKYEPFIESPEHSCGGYSLEQGKPNSDVIATFYKTGKVKKKRKFHSKRLWRTCAGCAHDKILREVPKIQDEQELYTLFYTVMLPSDYRKLVSRFTTWRGRALAEWHKAIEQTPAGEPLPKPPHDIVYIGYKIAGAIVVVHNQTSLVRRGADKYELIPMPTEKRAIYDLIGKWVADAPNEDTRQFVVGSHGFGGKFAGTRAVKKESDEISNESQSKELKSIKIKFPNCSALNEKKIDQLLKVKDQNRYGLGKAQITLEEFRSDLKAMGIEHEIMGGEGLYKRFVTEVGVINAKPNDDELCHKVENQSDDIVSKNNRISGNWSQSQLFREDSG